MDFHAMTRKQLQSLCKEHGIPANLRNTEMADRLTLLLKQDENLEENEREIDYEVETKKVKKVKFSPENQTFYFVGTDNDSDTDREYNPKKKPGVKRKSMVVKKVSKKKQAQVSENSRELELSVEITDSPGRFTRSRAQKLVQGDAEAVFSPHHKKKQAQVSENSRELELAVEMIDSPGSVTRSRAQKMVQGDAEAVFSPLPKKKQVQVSEKSRELELFDPRGRVTRSRAQTMVKGYAETVFSPLPKKKKLRTGVKKVDVCDKPQLEVELSEKVDGNADHAKLSGGLIQRQLRSRAVVSADGGNSLVLRKNVPRGSKKAKENKGSNAVLLPSETYENNVPAGKGVKPQKVQKNYKGNVTKVEDSSVWSEKSGKIDLGGRITRSRTQVEGRSSGVETKTGILKVLEEGEEVLQLKETLKGLGRKHLRQKSAAPLKGSVEGENIAGEAVEPGKTTRRSKRNLARDSVCGQFTETIVVGRRKKPKTEFLRKASIQEECKAVSQLEEQSEGPSMNTSRRKFPVVQKGKEQTKGDTRKRPRNTDLERDSKVKKSVETIEESVVLLNNGPLRRSRRKTTLFSSAAPDDQEFRICEDTGTVKQSTESVAEKGTNVTKPTRRSSRNVYEIAMEANDDMGENSNGVKKDRIVKQIQEPTLGKEIVNDSSNKRSQRRSSHNASKSDLVVPTGLTGIASGKDEKSESRIPIIAEEVLFAKSNSPLEENPNLDVGLDVPEAAGNENDIDSCSSNEVVEKSSKKSESLNRGDAGGGADDHSCPSVTRGDTGHDSAVEHNLVECPGTLSNVVSSRFTCVGDGQSCTYQPDCEGECSNLLDLKEGLETDESLNVKTNQRSDAVDDQLADSSKASVHEDPNLVQLNASGIDQPVRVEPVIEDQLTELVENKESDRNTEKSAEVVEEISALSPCDGKDIVQVDKSCPSLNRGDTGHDNVGEQNQVECPDKLSNVVSSRFTSQGDDHSPTYQLDCVGESSNLLDLEEGLQTGESSTVKTPNQRSNAVDDHLEDDSKATVPEDQNLVQLDASGTDQPVPVETVLEDHLTKLVEHKESDRNTENSSEVVQDISACDREEMFQVDVGSKKTTETTAETTRDIHQGRIVPCDTAVTSSRSLLGRQAVNQFEAQPTIVGQSNVNHIRMKDSCNYVNEVPEEATSSWKADILCGHDRTEEVMPEENQSFKALGMGQTVEEVLNGGFERNSNLGAGAPENQNLVQFDASGIINRNTEKSSEVVEEIIALCPCDREEMVQVDTGSIKAAETNTETIGDIHQGRIVPCDTAVTPSRSSLVKQAVNKFEAQSSIVGQSNINHIGMEDSCSYVNEIPSSSKSDILSGHEGTVEIIPEEFHSFKALEMGQTAPYVVEEVLSEGFERNSKLGDGAPENQNLVQFDASGIYQQVLVEPVLDDHLNELVDNKEADRSNEKSSEVVEEITALCPCEREEMVQFDVGSTKTAETTAETTVDIHQGRIVPCDTAVTPFRSSLVKQAVNQFEAQSTIVGQSNINHIGMEDSCSYVNEVPDEATSSWKADILCGHERNEEGMPEENQSIKALEMGQTSPSIVEEVLNEGFESNSKLDDGVPEDQNLVHLDASGTHQPVPVEPVLEDLLSKLVEHKESDRKNTGKSSEVVEESSPCPCGSEEMVQVDVGSTKTSETTAETTGDIHQGRIVPCDTAVTPSRSSPVKNAVNQFEAQFTIVGQSNINHIGMKDSCSYVNEVPDEATSSLKGDVLCGHERTEEVMPEVNQFSKALDIVQTAPSFVQEFLNECFERNSNLDDGAPENQNLVQFDASGTHQQVLVESVLEDHLTELVENKESDRSSEKSSEIVEEIIAVCPCDREGLVQDDVGSIKTAETRAATVGDIHQGRIVPGDTAVTPSRSSLVKQDGKQFEKNVEEKEMTYEDRGNDSLDVIAPCQEDEVAREIKVEACKVDRVKLNVDKFATSSENAEGLSAVQKDNRALELPDKSEIFTHWEMSTIFGDAEQDATENSDKPVKGYSKNKLCENAMNVVDNTNIFYLSEPILGDNERFNEQDDVSAIIQEYIDCEKDRDEHFGVKNSNVCTHKPMFTEASRIDDSDYTGLGDIAAENMTIPGVEDKYGISGVAEDRSRAMTGDRMGMHQPENENVESRRKECWEADLDNTTSVPSVARWENKKDNLIPSTPTSLVKTFDMKENFTSTKSNQVFDSPKTLQTREALEDLQKK